MSIRKPTRNRPAVYTAVFNPYVLGDGEMTGLNYTSYNKMTKENQKKFRAWYRKFFKKYGAKLLEPYCFVKASSVKVGHSPYGITFSASPQKSYEVRMKTQRKIDIYSEMNYLPNVGLYAKGQDMFLGKYQAAYDKA